MVVSLLTDGKPSHRDVNYPELERGRWGAARLMALTPGSILLNLLPLAHPWAGEGGGWGCPILSGGLSSAGKGTQRQAESHLEARSEEARVL